MAGRKRRAAAPAPTVPDIYAEMLAEAGVGRRTIPERTAEAPPEPTVQTVERDTDDEDDDDVEFEDVDIGSFDVAPQVTSASLASGSTEQSGGLGAQGLALELNLTAQLARKPPTPKKKAISREEKDNRVDVHKVHVLCLLAHCAQRNRWCNDPAVQARLRSLLSKMTIAYLNPGANLTQFGRTNSLKNGLEQVSDLFKKAFQITERGLRRALWAEDKEHLEQASMIRSLSFCKPAHWFHSMNRLPTWTRAWTCPISARLPRS
jgi:xeroderma pigmentosum group C-complementing protein